MSVCSRSLPFPARLRSGFQWFILAHASIAASTSLIDENAVTASSTAPIATNISQMIKKCEHEFLKSFKIVVKEQRSHLHFVGSLRNEIRSAVMISSSVNSAMCERHGSPSSSSSSLLIMCFWRSRDANCIEEPFDYVELHASLPTGPTIQFSVVLKNWSVPYESMIDNIEPSLEAPIVSTLPILIVYLTTSVMEYPKQQFVDLLISRGVYHGVIRS